MQKQFAAREGDGKEGKELG